MNLNFQKLLTIAEDNAKKNPSIVGEETQKIAKRYLNGLIDEAEEVADEFKDNNAIHLQDELSDVAWDYFMVLKICEARGWIDSVEAVFEHAQKKYAERSPAFIKADQELWENVKERQKEDLKQKNTKRYGV